MTYYFKKGPNQTVIIADEKRETAYDEANLKKEILYTRLNQELFVKEEFYQNTLSMYESALKFLLEEQA
ncbi:MAG TPA: hypothetical protein DCS05_08015 [Nitrospiraceae bacterium]|nr:hypothetical protein [Nitrospiraceae bacterium]